MRWIALAFTDWSRRPLRNAIAVAGVGVGVAALSSILFFQKGYERAVHQEMDSLGAQILLVPKGCPYDAASMALHGANWPCHLKMSYLAEIRSINGVSEAAPVLMNAAVDPATGESTILEAIDESFLHLKPGLRLNGCFPKGSSEVVLGHELARQHNWNTGAVITLRGTPLTDVRVAGVFDKTRGAEDFFVFLPLSAGQQLFSQQEKLTHILVKVRRPEELDATSAQLRGCDAGMNMNVVPVAQLLETMKGAAHSTRMLLGTMAVLALFCAWIGVGHTIFAAIHERRQEIGLFRAMGASRADIIHLFTLHTLALCLLGTVAGLGTAFLSSWILEAFLHRQIPLAPKVFLVQWDWPIALGALAAASIPGFISAAGPIWQAARIQPTMAFRR